MRKTIYIAAIVFVLVAGLVTLSMVNRDEEGSASKAAQNTRLKSRENPTQSNQDTHPMAASAGQAARPASADKSVLDENGVLHIPYVILDEAHGDDPEAVARFIGKYARNMAEKERMESYSPYAKARKAVRLGSTFQDLGRKLLRGEKVEKLNLPSFGGEDFEVELSFEDSISETSGSDFGTVGGDPYSVVVICYYKDQSGGTVKIPAEGLMVAYTPHTSDIMIIYDMDERAYQLANSHQHHHHTDSPTDVHSHDGHDHDHSH